MQEGARLTEEWCTEGFAPDGCACLIQKALRLDVSPPFGNMRFRWETLRLWGNAWSR